MQPCLSKVNDPLYGQMLKSASVDTVIVHARNTRCNACSYGRAFSLKLWRVQAQTLKADVNLWHSALTSRVFGP